MPNRTQTRKAAVASPAKTTARKGRVAASSPKQPPIDPHLREVENAISAMTVEHVQCRDFGHSWRPFHAEWKAAEQCYESLLRCSRCSTVRTRYLSRSGAQLQSKYDYADGYQTKGLGRLSGSDRDVVRLHSILSVLVEDTAAEA